jgi:endonuclease YncB( thermonuclease family)
MNPSDLLTTLSQSTCESCPLFSLYNTRAKCKIVDIYDGDTVDVVILYNNQLYHFKGRLYGYDSPEMKPPKTDPNRDAIKQRANNAKQRLWNLVTGLEPTNFTGQHNRLLTAICGEFDKYGRILLNIFPAEMEISETWNITNMNEWFTNTINSQMINEGHGYPYYGGTKQK